MRVRINWEHKRVKQAIERMWLRGISVREVHEAIVKGKRAIQRETGLVRTIYRHFVVVYEERLQRDAGIRKVFPVTVKVVG